MASVKVWFFLCLVAHVVFFLLSPVDCNDREDSVLQGINSYRESLNVVPPLSKNKKAACLAEEVAEELEDRPCSAVLGTESLRVDNYPDQLEKCGIDVNTTGEGVVLPVCVPKLVPAVVLTNYTGTQYARYVNDSKYTGVGMGSEDGWMVVVLTTNTPGGSFSGANILVSHSHLRFASLLLLGMLTFFIIII